MAKKRTIHQAISEVLADSSDALTPEEIYDTIIERSLYTFPAKDPLHVVATTLRRHCVNRDFPTARRKKYFSVGADGRYSLLPTPVVAEPTAFKIKVTGRRKSERIISVPGDDEMPDTPSGAGDETHTEIQWRLLDLGSRLGMSVWAPKNDRGRTWSGGQIGDVPKMLDKLPQQFDPSAMEIVSFIDVIWLQNRTLYAAFEVEHTTPIYSGLLRMADLMTLVPNQDLKWFVVSSNDRFDRFARQVIRPVFQEALRKPLHSVCRFLSYQRLLERLHSVEDVIDDLKPSFIDRIAEEYDPSDAFAG